jgi:hypothetical protein
MEDAQSWIIIVRGEADGQDVRVAIDFQDAEVLFHPRSHSVGGSFIDRLLALVGVNENWVVKTIIEEVRTPQGSKISLQIPIFALLTRSRPRGLSAGALFIADEEIKDSSSQDVKRESDPSLFQTPNRFRLAGISPVGFAAACAEDSRLFTRFITRLLQKPDGFRDVSVLLPRQVIKSSEN